MSEDLTGRYHGLAHGTTLHGMQALAPERRGEALTYFHQTGPFGQAWNALPQAADGARRSRSSGSASARSPPTRGPAQHWTFFEIDPAIERIARTPEYFSFMDACGDRCHVVIGDARISLTRVPEHAYDLLVLDAFSSDSIPMHLMTREAFSLYLSRLAPDGALVMHISNRHLRLAPVVARLAASQGLDRAAADRRDGAGLAGREERVALDRDELAARADLDVLTQRPPMARRSWRRPSTPLWTDDFSNILSVLSVR